MKESKQKEHISQLYIGSGKVDLKQLDENSYQKDKTFFRVFLDRSYDKGNSIDFIEEAYSEWLLGNESKQYDRSYYCNQDIFKFMDSYKFKFDQIYAYRIFEHMEYCGGEIGRLLEACNILTNENSILQIIVPNSIKLSELLLDYEKNYKNYDTIASLNAKLIINTEFCNIKCDPHGSIWTPKLASEYIESEGTWFIKELQPQIYYAGRNIYMRINCIKNKLVKEGK